MKKIKILNGWLAKNSFTRTLFLLGRSAPFHFFQRVVVLGVDLVLFLLLVQHRALAHRALRRSREALASPPRHAVLVQSVYVDALHDGVLFF